MLKEKKSSTDYPFTNVQVSLCAQTRVISVLHALDGHFWVYVVWFVFLDLYRAFGFTVGDAEPSPRRQEGGLPGARLTKPTIIYLFI